MSKDMKHTLLIGTDFKSSSLNMREKVHFDDDIKPEIIRRITSIANIDECVILTTCNRVEIYLACANTVAAKELVVDFLMKFHQIPKSMIEKKMFFIECDEAARHLFRVSTGLESMVVGESEILGQIKRAYHLSKSAGGSGPYLNKLFQMAIALGKQARSKTTVNSGVTSIGAAASKLASEIADPQNSKYGVIGCGQMGSIIAKNLVRRGAHNLHLSNRTTDKGKRLATEIKGDFYTFNSLDRLLNESDVLITATSSETPIISKVQIEKALKNRSKLVIIDIATPRDVDEAAKDLDKLDLYTIDDLKEIVDQNIKIREASVTLIENLIEKKLSHFTKWYEHKSEYEEETDYWEPRISSGTHTIKYSKGQT